MRELKYTGIIGFVLFYCLTCFQIFAQSASDTANITDAQGWKQGRWVTISQENNPEGCKAGIKVEEGTYKDNRKVGTWRKWWCNGNLKNELIYNPDKTIYSKDYYENGNLKEEGQWNSAGWIGSYKFYYPNGKIYYDWKFDTEGRRTGTQKYYFDNGNVMFDGEWNEGKESGIIKEYYENGSLLSEKYYNDGKLDTNRVKIYPKKAPIKIEEKTETVKQVETQPEKSDVGAINDGFHKTFNREGKVDLEGEFKNAKLYNGKKYYYKDGQIEKIAIYKKGKVVQYEQPKPSE
ncbi:MAG: hypothetical protein IT238_08210 [Bacteroidia bacterium]|nr:hypothetical protein [Bacteroidia bacterium]MCZ2248573.1 hypothetical protein [Bacteroidia bacterium]